MLLSNRINRFKRINANFKILTRTKEINRDNKYLLRNLLDITQGRTKSQCLPTAQDPACPNKFAARFRQQAEIINSENKRLMHKIELSQSTLNLKEQDRTFNQFKKYKTLHAQKVSVEAIQKIFSDGHISRKPPCAPKLKPLEITRRILGPPRVELISDEVREEIHGLEIV